MSRQKRFDLIDAIRGSAVIQMMLFHFCFLLKEFRLAFLDFSVNEWWLNFRTLIVFQFLLLVGISLKIAASQRFSRQRFFRRQLQLLVYAGIVSFTTYLIEPQRMVTFGVLQFIFVASLVAVFLVRLSFYNLILAVVLGWMGLFWQFSTFNVTGLNWLGMVTEKPVTLDYVPFLPWFSVVLLGLYTGQFVVNAPYLGRARRWKAKTGFARLLVQIGRHSLNLYMLHMPFFFMIIYCFVKTDLF